MAAEFNPSVNMFLPPRRGPLPFCVESIALFANKNGGGGIQAATLAALEAALTETLQMAKSTVEKHPNPPKRRRGGARVAEMGIRDAVLLRWGGEEPFPWSGEPLVDTAVSRFEASPEEAEFAARVILSSAARRAKLRGAAALDPGDCDPPPRAL